MVGSRVHLLYGCDEMTYKLGKDGCPTDEAVISTRDKEIESLRQRVHTFESLETKRMKDAVTVEDWRRIAEHMEYNWRCCSDGFNKTASDLRQQLAESDTNTMRLIETIKYLVGIAERGEGREQLDDETVEQFVLGYVKRIEKQLAECQKQHELVTSW